MNSFLIEFITFFLIWFIFIMFFYEYGILTRWMYKNRFLIEGSLIGMGISFIVVIASNKNHTLDIISLLIILPAFLIITAFYFIRYRGNFKNLCKETKFEKEEGEEEIMSDQAALMNENVKKAGRLILTNKRLCFVTKDAHNYSFEINLHDLTKAPEIVNNFGLFNVFSIQDGKIKIYIKYRRYWIKEIKKKIRN